jgi:hypothetical protein
MRAHLTALQRSHSMSSSQDDLLVRKDSSSEELSSQQSDSREESKYLISSELLYLGSVLVVMIRIVFNPNASTSHRPESKDIQHVLISR